MILFALASIVLNPPFARAEATAIEAGPPFVIEFTVEMADTVGAVLVRPVTVSGELEPIAMVDQGDDTWVGIVTFANRGEVLIGFEAIERGGDSSTLTSLYSLPQLGVDVALVDGASTTTTITAGRSLPAGIGWLAVGVVLLVAALLLIAIWASSENEDDEDKEAADPST